MRLDKLLAHVGAGTRKEVKLLIRKGHVMVNGAVCKKDDAHVDEQHDEILLDEEVIVYQKYYYIMLHKPVDYVSATSDHRYPTVMDLIDIALPKDMFPVGRLDIDTEGLLLLCNDGELAHRLLSPKNHVVKTYEVWIAHPLREEDMQLLESGTICLDEEALLPAKVDIIEPTHIYLHIKQGKYHQVKRMLQAVGNEVIRLKRMQMGPLILDENLGAGEWRFLSEEEEQALKAVK